MDLPSWLQFALTTTATVAFVAVLLMPRVGLGLLKKNPKSQVGLWLVARGSASRAVLEEVADFLPPKARALMESIPAIEVTVPVGAKVAIRSADPEGAPLSVTPGGVVTAKSEPPEPRVIVLDRREP